MIEFWTEKKFGNSNVCLITLGRLAVQAGRLAVQTGLLAVQGGTLAVQPRFPSTEHLRESPHFPESICPSQEETMNILR